MPVDSWRRHTPRAKAREREKGSEDPKSCTQVAEAIAAPEEKRGGLNSVPESKLLFSSSEPEALGARDEVLPKAKLEMRTMKQTVDRFVNVSEGNRITSECAQTGAPQDIGGGGRLEFATT